MQENPEKYPLGGLNTGPFASSVRRVHMLFYEMPPMNSVQTRYTGRGFRLSRVNVLASVLTFTPANTRSAEGRTVSRTDCAAAHRAAFGAQKSGPALARGWATSNSGSASGSRYPPDRGCGRTVPHGSETVPRGTDERGEPRATVLGERRRDSGNLNAVHSPRHAQTVATRLVDSGAQWYSFASLVSAWIATAKISGTKLLGSVFCPSNCLGVSERCHRRAVNIRNCCESVSAQSRIGQMVPQVVARARASGNRADCS